MFKFLVFLVLIGLGLGTKAQRLDVGIRVQKTHGMYWENGIIAQYAFKNFKPDNFYVGFSYITSRLGTAFGSNALKQDNYIAAAGWDFGKKAKPLRIHGRVNVGYFHAEQVAEIFADVPNSSFLFSPEFGVKYSFSKLPVTLNLGAGYYLLMGDSGKLPGTLQPLYYHLDVSYQIFKK